MYISLRTSWPSRCSPRVIQAQDSWVWLPGELRDASAQLLVAALLLMNLAADAGVERCFAAAWCDVGNGTLRDRAGCWAWWEAANPARPCFWADRRAARQIFTSASASCVEASVPLPAVGPLVPSSPLALGKGKKDLRADPCGLRWAVRGTIREIEFRPVICPIHPSHDASISSSPSSTKQKLKFS